ncbi:putative cytochrome P450 family protein [Rhizoctonia solani 123E]|uniref:Putative cytochrome P450 family protein n=1 Tax=Rhizoctonia solani 123E TaxID=1423351 RepID=A0A074S9A8_9AGAM|nr:putative cytochrome P450 family protein [Rhizoctonia solani 123E]
MRRSNSIRPSTSRSQNLLANTTVTNSTDDVTAYLDESSANINEIVQSRTTIGERDREIAKLKDHITTLTQVVNSRPPLEQVQALQKEYQNLELILQGTQRENERCMAELEKSKRREKTMEAELAKVYGDDWANHLGMATSSPSISRALPITANVRQSPPPQETNDGPSNAAINEHLEAVRMLVLGMDAKLAEREVRIGKEMARAEEEGQRAASARKKITAKVEPCLIHTPIQSRPSSRAASPLVTPTPAPIRLKAKVTTTLKPTGPNAAGKRTPASSSVGRSTRPVSTMGTPSKARPTTPAQLRPSPRINSPELATRTRPTVKATSTPKSVPSRRTQPTPNGNKSPVRAPPLAPPARSPLFKVSSPTAHRRVASASASSSVVSSGEGDLARARHKVPSSLSSINLTCIVSAPASPPTTYPALPPLPTLNLNPSDPHDSSPEPTDLSAPPSAVPSELVEEPKRVIVSAPVTPVHVQPRPVDQPVPTRPRTSSVTIVDGDTRPTLDDPVKDSPGIRIKAKLTATTPPTNPSARTIPHIRPEQLVVPRQRSGSISAGSSFSGLATSTLSRASSVRVTSASRILSPPLSRPGLVLPGAHIFIPPPAIRSPPVSNLSSTSSNTFSSGSDSSAPATSIGRTRAPIEPGLGSKLGHVPAGVDEHGVDRDDSGIDMFEVDAEREEARSNRKMADLEISNKSLLAINASLEATKSRQVKEINALRRRLRESRLVLPHSAYLALEQEDPLETRPNFEEEEEDSEENDVTQGQIQVDATFNRVRGLLDQLIMDAKTALEAKPPVPRYVDEEARKPIRVLDVDELEQYAETESKATETEPETETETETETDLAESIDEDSPSAIAEKAALVTPKHRSSFSVGVGVGVGIFSGWGAGGGGVVGGASR